MVNPFLNIHFNNYVTNIFMVQILNINIIIIVLREITNLAILTYSVVTQQSL